MRSSVLSLAAMELVCGVAKAFPCPPPSRAGQVTYLDVAAPAGRSRDMAPRYAAGPCARAAVLRSL